MAGFRAIFCGYSSSSTQSVWVTDGAEAGTFPITAEQSNAGLLPGVALAMPLGKYVLFPSAGAGNDSGLFISYGTVAGTHQIQVPDASPAGLSPAYITMIGDAAYFQGNSTNAAAAVFSTKGTTATTHVVVDAILAPTSFAALNGTLYFNGLIAHTNSMALYRLDPGNIATQLALTGFTRPDGLAGFGTKLLFRADDGAGQGLFCYDSVLGTASELKTAGGVKPTGLGNLTVFNGKVYFTAGSKLWRTDGTVAGTEQVSLPGIIALYDTPVVNSPLAILSTDGH